MRPTWQGLLTFASGLGLSFGLLMVALTPRPSLAMKEPNCATGTDALCRETRTCEFGFEPDNKTCNSTLIVVKWYYRG